MRRRGRPTGTGAPANERGRPPDPDADTKPMGNPTKKWSFWRVFAIRRPIVLVGLWIRLVDLPPKLPGGPPARRRSFSGESAKTLSRTTLPWGETPSPARSFSGQNLAKTSYIVANPSAPGSPGARAPRAGGGNSRCLRPAAEKGTSRKISRPPAGEYAPPRVALQGWVFPPLRELSGIAGRPFWRLGPGPGVVRGLVWETGGRPGL